MTSKSDSKPGKNSKAKSKTRHSPASGRAAARAATSTLGTSQTGSRRKNSTVSQASVHGKSSSGQPGNVRRLKARERLGLHGKNLNELREQIAEGFTVDTLHKLADELDLSVEQILPVVHLSRRTWTRRQQSGRLTPEESDRLAATAVVFSEAEELFEGDREAARRWMTSPAPALGGDRPIDVISTETGARQVSGLIHKLEHGVFA